MFESTHIFFFFFLKISLRALQSIVQDPGYEKWFEGGGKAGPGLTDYSLLRLWLSSSRRPPVASQSSHTGLVPVLAEGTRGPSRLWVLLEASQTMSCLFSSVAGPWKTGLSSLNACNKKLWPSVEAGGEEGLWPFLKWGRENVALALKGWWMWTGRRKGKERKQGGEE